MDTKVDKGKRQGRGAQAAFRLFRMIRQVVPDTAGV